MVLADVLKIDELLLVAKRRRELTPDVSTRLELESFGISFVAEPLVAHDRVATAAGCLAGINLDRWVLAKFLPNEIVSQCISSASPWGFGLEEFKV